MDKNCDYLFAYGTLLDKDNALSWYVNSRCLYCGEGKFRGELYDTGEYPAAIVIPFNSTYVYGKIFSIDEPDAILKVLDDYEVFGPEQEQPNLFIREQIAVETAKGLLNCWIYLYNLPVTGLKLIPSGDYLVYKGIKFF